MLKNLYSSVMISWKQGEIEMVSEGKFEWLLWMWWYTYNHSTGSVETDQVSTIDILLEQNGLTSQHANVTRYRSRRIDFVC